MNNKDTYKDYVKVLNKLKRDMYHYTIDGKDVTEEEFINFIKTIQNKIRRK